MTNHKKQQWEDYRTKQLGAVTPLLLDEGFILETDQPHISGERYLLSGPKLVLLGIRKSDDMRVVIKITDDTKEATALTHEKSAIEVLHTMRFGYTTFHAPKEILFGKKNQYTFFITKYIPQETAFLERPIEEQFFFALKAFEAQEGFHATTHSHQDSARKHFEVFSSEKYCETIKKYVQETRDYVPDDAYILSTLSSALEKLIADKPLLEKYSHFLTHWDFVPHNIRIHKNDIYLLDHTSIRFGNKYDSWARFLNFMSLHNPPLEHLLDEYVQKNRFPDEHATLRALRIFRLSELVWFYAKKLKEAEGDLLTLTRARCTFWTHMLEAHITDIPPSEKIIQEYKKTRDSLRDTEEKKRQENLH
jgi:hypothetical protein